MVTSRINFSAGADVVKMTETVLYSGPGSSALCHQRRNWEEVKFTSSLMGQVEVFSRSNGVGLQF